MAQGDVTWFNHAIETLLEGSNANFATDQFRLGIIDNTAAPTANQTTPGWGDFSANQVATGGTSYTGPLAMTTASSGMVSNVYQLDFTDITISQDASGFTDGYWGIVYDDTTTGDIAVCYIDLGGPASLVAGDININFSASPAALIRIGAGTIT